MRPVLKLCAAAALAVLFAAAGAAAYAQADDGSVEDEPGAPHAATPDAAPPGAESSAVASACAVPSRTGAARLSDAVLDALVAQLPQCQDRPNWLVAVGQRLNEARRYQEAADLVERALLLEPALKGARVDYAVALAGSGDLLAARALLGDILAEPDLPPGLRSVLLRQHGTLPLALAAGWRVDGSAGLRVGRDSNLLGAPNLESVTLTLGGQLVEVLLDESYRSRAGSYQQADAALAILRVLPGGGRWQIGMGLRERVSPSAPAADSRQAEGLLEVSEPLPGVAPWRGYAAVATAALRSGLTDYATRTLALGLEGAVSDACDARLGAEDQHRDYSSNPVLSGRYRGLTASIVCGGGASAGRLPGQTLASVRLGSDDPRDSARPGGRQKQTVLRLATHQPAARLWRRAPGFVLLDAEWSRQQDSTGYSQILESGHSRNIVRSAVRLEWRLPLAATEAGRFEPAIGLETMSQRSNIRLFGLRSSGPYLALRARW